MQKILKRIFYVLPVLALVFIWACTQEETGGDEYLRIELSETLKDYSRVLITLVNSNDTNSVYDTVWNAAIADPKSFPRFKLNVAKGKDFTIAIRAFNADGALLWAKNIAIVGEVAQKGVISKTDLRLFSLALSKGEMNPAFHPSSYQYLAAVGDSIESVVFTARLMDSTNGFTLNNEAILPGQAIPPQALRKGPNSFRFSIKSPETGSLDYIVVVTRGGDVIDTSILVTALSVKPESLTVFKGEAGKSLAATVDPSYATLYWSSQNDGIAKVDGAGTVTGVDAGSTTIMVRAGKKSTSVKVTVIKDAPVLTVGDNIAVKLNSEVVFPISVIQNYGTIKAFKYDLEGDGIWDNADSLSGVYPASLKHTYTAAVTKTFVARFYIRDSEGNEVDAFRSITVSDAEFLIAIVSPSKDTLVNKTPITVRYIVNGFTLVRTFPLMEGKNPLSVDTGTGTGKVSAMVNVTLDTTPPKVEITSPKDSTYTNANSIEVVWTVDGIKQTTQTSEDLGTLDGTKSISRQSMDSAGNVGASAHRIFLDTEAPTAPNVNGASPTNDTKPTWTWTSGVGGNGVFRFKLDSNSLGSSAETQVKSFSPTADLSLGIHTLFVQERDAAGNWSESASLPITIISGDTIPPAAPKITGSSPTNAAPKWSWSTGGNGGAGEYRFKVGDNAFVPNSLTTRDTTYTMPGAAASGSVYFLYVQERDAAGNWSATASLGILYDATKPTVVIDSPQVSGTYVTVLPGVKLHGSVSGPNPITKVSYKVDGGTAADAVFAAGKWTIDNIPLTEDKISTLVITASDNANNSSDATLQLQRDNSPPGAPVIAIAPPAKTSQTLATWTWSAGPDGANGSGLNGNYRYNLNGSAWSAVTQETIVKDLTLSAQNGGLNIFYLQQQDNADNWSASVSSTVRLDTVGPLIVLTSPASNPASSNSSKVTVSATITDAGCPVASVSVAGQISGGGQLTQSGTTWTSANLGLAQGANSLVLTALDSLGNFRKLTVTINVTVAKPTVTITSPSNDNTLTNKGIIIVSYTVNGADRTQEFTLSSEGVNSLTVNSLPADNELGIIGSATVKVTRDATKPNAPTLSAVSTLTRLNPSLTWNSGGDVAGGGGLPSTSIFQYQYLYKGNYSAFIKGTGKSFEVSGLSDGSYTFFVQEQDNALNWSSSSNGVTIIVDHEGPSLSIDGPSVAGRVTSENPHVYGTMSDINGISKVGYVLNPGNRTGSALISGTNWTLDLMDYTDNVTNTLTVTAYDKADNPSAPQEITITKRSKVIFVIPGKGGNGKSWETAYSTLDEAAVDPRATAGGGQIWMAKGTYTASKVIVLPKDGGLIGGFSATTNPADSSGRLLEVNKSILSGVQLLTPTSGELSVVDGFTTENGSSFYYNYFTQTGSARILRFNNVNLNGFRVTYIPIQGETEVKFNAQFIGCNIKAIPGFWNFQSGALDLSFVNCTFSQNTLTSALVVASLMAPSTIYFNKSNLTDDSQYPNPMMEFMGSAHVTFEKTTVKYGIETSIAVDPANLTVIP